MTINERIKYFRKEIEKKSQKQFAEDLGVTQSGVSYMEQQGSTVADQTIKLICSVCGIREKWLRTGEEPMYKVQETFDLNKFAKERGASDFDLKIVKAYFALDPKVRKMLLEHFRAELLDDDNEHPKTPEELESQYKVEDAG